VATTAPPSEAPSTSDERVREVGFVQRLLVLPGTGAVLITILLWTFFAIVASGNNFVSWSATAAILNRAAPLGILAIAVCLLMIGGEFDLSIGSIIGFSGMAIMLGVTPSDAGGFGWPLWIAVLVALILALLIGVFNGMLVVTTRLPSFIVTLGSLFIFRGLAIAITRQRTNRTQLGNLDEADGFGFWDTLFGTEISLFGASFDMAILWWVGLVVIATWILSRTEWGNWIFGTGGAQEAARNVGVPTRRVKVILFMTTAFAGFLVALIQAVQFTGSDALRGTLQEFNAIIAVVVGGTLLTGGYGSAVGAFFGALAFATLQQGVIIWGVDADWFRVFVGGLLVVAVVFNNYIRQRAARR
jgi:simple sugar transport system permease protein